MQKINLDTKNMKSEKLLKLTLTTMRFKSSKMQILHAAQLLQRNRAIYVKFGNVLMHKRLETDEARSED